jgi:hypothetical protein
MLRCVQQCQLEAELTQSKEAAEKCRMEAKQFEHVATVCVLVLLVLGACLFVGMSR